MSTTSPVKKKKKKLGTSRLSENQQVVSFFVKLFFFDIIQLSPGAFENSINCTCVIFTFELFNRIRARFAYSSRCLVHRRSLNVGLPLDQKSVGRGKKEDAKQCSKEAKLKGFANPSHPHSHLQTWRVHHLPSTSILKEKRRSSTQTESARKLFCEAKELQEFSQVALFPCKPEGSFHASGYLPKPRYPKEKQNRSPYFPRGSKAEKRGRILTASQRIQQCPQTRPGSQEDVSNDKRFLVI